MSDQQVGIFDYEGKEVRTVFIEGEPWWVLKDVCDILNISNSTDVANRLDHDERARFNLGRQGLANIINEPGLYKVVLRSDKPKASGFMRWITHDVIPQLRKTGVAALSEDSVIEEALRILNRRTEALQLQNDALTERNAILEPKGEYYDIFIDSANNMSVGQFAAILCGAGIDAKPMALFSYLRDRKYLISIKGTNWNKPYQEYINKGYFVYKYPEGVPTASPTPMITPRGSDWLLNRIKQDVNNQHKLVS